jgi:AcrR family transcriptional regulator
MVRPVKKKQIPNLQEAIKKTAWKQIAEFGAPALSLRAIARDLKITAPAIYNYFPRRDDLVTALIVDAYTSLADAEEDALVGLPADDYATRLADIGRAYRQWALAHPERYNLIFGTPISGYEAPAELTVPAATRALAVMMSVLQAALQAGKLRVPPEYEATSPEMLSQIGEWHALQPGFDSRVLHFGLVVWGVVHGLVSLEIYGQFPPMIRNTDELFEIEVQCILSKFIR